MKEIASLGRKRIVDVIYSILGVVFCFLISPDFSVADENARLKSIGYVTSVVAGPESRLESFFRKRRHVFEAPNGKDLGELERRCEGLDCSTASSSLVDRFGHLKRAPIVLVSDICDTDQILVFDRRDVWVQISVGWIKLDDSLEFKSWRDYFAANKMPGGYSFSPLTTQSLREFDYDTAKILYTRKESNRESIEISGKHLFLLEVRGDFGFVLVSDQDSSTYNDLVAPIGSMGWIRVVSPQGFPLLKSDFGCM